MMDDEAAQREPYSVFRARAREALAAAGWRREGDDSESDYFTRGGALVYTAPYDVFGRINEGCSVGDPVSHRIVLMTFPSGELRSAWLTDGEDFTVDGQPIHPDMHTYDSVAAAVRAIALDQ